MPRDGTNRLARIAAALQWDNGRWFWLLLILLALGVVLGLGDNVNELLRYDRGAIAAGGWWRLLTAHIVHLDAHHLILNGLGLVLMWSLFAADYDPVEWCAIVLAGALAISSGLWWLSPRVAWYVGASGVLHSVMAAGAAKHLVERAWDRGILMGLLGAKLVYEQLGLHRQFGLHEQPLVVVDAHLYGALCGFALGAALSGRTAIIRHRSSV
ncbi:MAG: rhombosortase [Pseudomonadota bacterium]|nr:rhombosortase [Pseudomonadota bacterium]